MTNLSAAAVLFARTAYSTMHDLTMMIGVLNMNVLNGLIPNADKKIRRMLMKNVTINKEVNDNKVNEERKSPEITGNLRQISSAVNPVKELIPNHIYQFKKPFDAYFCMDGRVQVKKGAICECKKTDSVSTTLYFFGSNNNLPFEASCHISKRCSENLLDITETAKKKIP